jgi:hypothetical protein
MAGRKGLYRIFLMNLSGKDPNDRWNEAAFNEVGDRVQAHFQRVIAHPACPFTSVRWFPGHAGMILDPDELLVYFVASYRSSVIEAAGGRLKDTTFMKEGGATWESRNGMISEVWLDGSPLKAANPLSDGDYQKLFANTAFHELMHNKLDSQTRGAVLNDLHTEGGGGLADQNFTAGTRPTDKNIELMAKNLARPIPQNTAAANVSMVLMDGMPVLIDDGKAPTP